MRLSLAVGTTQPEPGWAVEAAASAGNRSAIPTAARKTPPGPPPAFPAATHSPGDGDRSSTLDQQKGGLTDPPKRTPSTEENDSVASLRPLAGINRNDRSDSSE